MRNQLRMILLVLVALMTAPAWAQSYPATDAFSGSGALSSSWTQVAPTGLSYPPVPLVKSSGTVVPNTAASWGMAVYTGETFTADQYAQVKFVAHATGGWTGPCVRMSAGAFGYCYAGDQGAIVLFYDGQWYQALTTSCPVPASGDTVKISATGTTITCTDVTKGTNASVTDSTYWVGSIPGVVVDTRSSSVYALTSFQADCVPTCSLGTVATPTFSPAAGTYSSAQTVTISDATSGATIHYTTNGSTPTASSTTYSSPISVSTSETVKAIGIKSGYANSAVGSAAYTISSSPYPAMDAFSGSGALSANWTNTTAYGQTFVPLAQSSGKAVPSTSGSQGLETYTGETFTANQYSQAKFVNHTTSGGATGVCVRMSTSGNGICWLADSGVVFADYNGAYFGPNIAPGCPTPASGDTIQLSVTGTTYTCTDVTTGIHASGTDTNYSTGNPGIIVDQRSSSLYALAAFQADCVPTCGGGGGTVATPTFSPGAGTYTSAQSVTISDATSGATIHYTTNGSTPTASSTTYTAPISVSTSETVKAIGVLSGSTNSAVGSAAYTINLTVATPTFSPGAGTYTSAQTVTISDATSGATIHYTTNGSTPTASSTTYTAPISVSTSETIKAIGVLSGYTNSAVGSAAYTITLTVATPTFSPGAGTYTSAQMVTISDATSGATIHYTTDGSTPTTSSTTYASPISVSVSETVKAIGVKSGYTNSAVGSAAYTISSGSGHTWYVRPDGGTRYSTNMTAGLCDGTADAAPVGSTPNQHCAFNDVRMLYQDGSYTVGDTFPGWGWVGAGGDTYIIRGSIGTGVSYRIGYNDPSNYCGPTGCWGIAGNPYGSGMPPPPSGTASQHTRLLGENYAACTSQSAKTQLHGGYGASNILNLGGDSYVDVACFDMTDFSSCGKQGQVDGCSTSSPLSDFAGNGIGTYSNSTNDTITDINVHGLAVSGMAGPTGDGVVLTRVTLSGNASAGWNMDPGDGTTGTGHLTLSHFNVLFNGCAEVYPISTTLNVGLAGGSTATVGAVGDCTDDNEAGYGDGIGTATVTSSPAWIMAVDHSTAAYNTQDGFDLLHLQGGGSTLTITKSLAYGNEGQQLKMGAAGTAINNVFVGNCNALRQPIPGLPSGYNSRLSDFCRASDTAIVMTVSDGSTTKYLFNTLYSANSVALEISLNGSCGTTCYLQYENNIMLGFTNDTANGYPGGGSGDNADPIFFDSAVPFGNSGSSNSNNATFGQKAGVPCPNTSYAELNAVCSDPGLSDETFHLYGYGNMAPASDSSPVVGAGVTITGTTTDFKDATRANPPTIGACETTATCP